MYPSHEANVNSRLCFDLKWSEWQSLIDSYKICFLLGLCEKIARSGPIQSFIYEKCLVCIPRTKQLCGLNYKSLSSFNGARSCFLSDEDFVGSVNSGW